MAMIKINPNMLSEGVLRELAENMLEMQSRGMVVKLIEAMNDPDLLSHLENHVEKIHPKSGNVWMDGNDPDVLCYFENCVDEYHPESGKVSAIKFLRAAGIELYAGLKAAKDAVENGMVITLRQSQIEEIQKGMTGYSWQLYSVAN